jgi:hypothetical protein
LGVYPGGYFRNITRSYTSSRDAPAIGGPWLPGRLGSALWQTTQLVMYTIRPRCAGVIGAAGPPHAEIPIASIVIAITDLMNWSKNVCTDEIARKNGALDF